jgi:hypothetical protein
VPHICRTVELLFCFWFILLSLVLLRFTHVVVYIRISCLFKAESSLRIPHFNLSTYSSLINIWVAFTLWLLCIMLLWTLVFKCLSHYFHFWGGYIPVCGILDHMIILSWSFWGPTMLYSTVVLLFCFIFVIAAYMCLWLENESRDKIGGWVPCL